LSSEAVVNQGMPINLGNKLTYFLYGFLFRIFGFYQDLPMHTAFILYSLAAVFIFFIVRRLFDFKTGLISALLISLAPFSLPSSQAVGSNEWSWLFLVLATLFYFLPKERKLKHLILTGLFLGLSAAAKNSFFVAFPPFVLLEFWEQRQIVKSAFFRSAILSISFLVIVVPFMLIGGNSYLDNLFGLPSKYVSSSDFNDLFPDPYTFHYDRDDFFKNHVANYGNVPGGQFQFWGKESGPLEAYGYKVDFIKGQIITRIYSLWIYFKGLFLSLIVFGGLLTWLFIFIGLDELLKKKNYSLVFFTGAFFVSWLSLLVFLKTSNYMQLLTLSLVAVMLVGAGIVKLSEIISKNGRGAMGIMAIFLFLFFQISWWSFHELSLNSGSTNNVVKLVKTEKLKQTIDRQGVTATGWSADLMAYYLDRSFIFFDPETIKKLADKKELGNVFKKYGVTGYIGFDKETSQIIKKNVNNVVQY